MPKLDNGVCTGDVVSLREPRGDIDKAIVVGFVLTHPDTDEVWVSWSGSGIQRVDSWPIDERLTAENIGIELRSAREQFRAQMLKLLSRLGLC